MEIKIQTPNLTSYQRDILFSDSRFTITEASTKVGKTYSHIIWLFIEAISCNIIGANFWWVAPVYSQSKIAYKRLKNYLLPYQVFKFHETELRIDLPNGTHIFFKTADKPDNLFGEDVYAAVFDEAPRSREEAWHALRSTLTATQGKCKLIGNFGGTANWMHQLKVKNAESNSYEYFKITCYDAVKEGIITQEEVEQAQRDLPPKIFRELYLAEASEDDDRLLRNEEIAAIWTNDYVKNGRPYITCDVARFGKDKTVVGLWSGMILTEIRELATSSVKEVVDLVRTIAHNNGVPKSNIIIDEDGVGGGVVDYLSVNGFVNNSSPIKSTTFKENYQNLKTQCIFRLAEEIRKGNMYFKIEKNKEIIEELEMLRVKGVDLDGKLQCYSKDEIKKIIGRSPDYSDMIMMRMYFELTNNITLF